MRYPPELASDVIADHGKTVVVIDDHPLVSASLRDLVSLYSFSAQVRSFSSFTSSLNVLQYGQPALVILDLGLPDIAPAEAIAAVRANAPNALLALLSGNDEIARRIPEIQNKTLPFLHKGLPHHMLTRAVCELLEQCGLANGIYRDAGTKDLTGLVPGRLKSLSPKQREILRLLATGRTNQEIAAALNVSTETIKTHLHDIYAKLQVKSRTQAVLLYQSAWRLADDSNRHDMSVA